MKSPAPRSVRRLLRLVLPLVLLAAGLRLLAPDPAKPSSLPPPAPTDGAPASVTAAPPPTPPPHAATPADARSIDHALARLRDERHALRQRRRADPAHADISAGLARLADEETRLTEARARLLEAPLVTLDGARLSHFDGDRPIYLRDFNANAAISTAASDIRSTSPYNVTGSGVKIGLWEVGGLPRSTHYDLTGRVTLGDSGSSSYHATHVAGTLAGDGTTSASVKGMAPAATLVAYLTSSYSDHSSELESIAATGEGSSSKIYLSNQSYGAASGWSYDGTNYSWYGTFSDDDDTSNDEVSNYGRYSYEAQELDQVASDYPYLTMFFSVGNDRGYGTPASGATWYLNGSASAAYAYDPATHPKDNENWMADGSVTGFGTLSPQSSAKNVIAIGAVNDAVSGGSRSTAAASMSDFSSYGPTDDGRIKPDLVANGVSVTSLSDSTDAATTTLSGTSMACPDAAGSAALLIDYYDNKFSGQSMRASLLKALLIHTADDLGNAGPDYRHGWGLINAKTAASLIKETAADSAQSRFIDGQLSTTDASDTFSFTYDGAGELRVTLAWTDPEGSIINTHDSRSARLVHDLNLTLTGPDGTHYPYVMPWVGNWSDSKLNDAATTGVNTVDNVEQVYLSAPVSGTYTITVSHAGSLTSAQIYSLVLTGGDFASSAPDAGSSLAYDVVAGFGSISSINVYDRFSSANETTYSVSVDDSSIVTAALDASGNLTIAEAGVGTTYVRVTATNDLGESATLVITVQVRAGVLYVDASHSSGTKNGSSWATAYDTLTAALSAAQSGQEIWVADGVYYPTTPKASPSAGDKYKSFEIPGGVSIYGGFAGNESSLSERDPDTHLAILSGDLDQNDTNRSDGITDTADDIVGNNTWLLVTTDNDSDDFRLDGLVFTGAKTDTASGSDDWAGIYVASGAGYGIIANCTFRGLDSEGSGGALYNQSTGLVIEDCEFSGNRTDASGGALASTKALTLTDCVFQSNSALGHGGALHLSGSTHLLRRCVFQGNSCEMDGGAISFTDGGNAAITNCLITGNSAYGGASNSNGGAFAVGNASTLTISNSTLCSNNSEYPGGAFWIYGASKVYLRNCIARENARAGNTSDTYAFVWIYDASSSLTWSNTILQSSSDPLLGSVPAPSTAPTLAGDFKPSSGSPAIDAGSKTSLIDQTGAISGATGDETGDLSGDPRIVDGNYNGTVYIDIGCYEYDAPAVTATIADIAIDAGSGLAGASLDLDDYFGGTGLSYAVASSSASLLTTLDDENTLVLSLVNTALGDSAFTVTVTATDSSGQSVSQSFAVTFALTRLYVDAAATGAANGRSWTHAFTELRDALAYASSGDEVWLAAGVYKPSASDRATGFVLPGQISLHGGFAGGESSLDEATPETHVTVLSGDIDGDDTVDADGVTLSYADQGPGGGNTSVPLIDVTANLQATLTGLVLCGGASGALQTESGSSLTLTDCVVRGNRRSGDGGALNALGATHTIADCRFLQNYASGHAGAVRYGPTGTSTLTFDRCVLAGNEAATRGGGLAIKGGSGSNRTLTLRDCLLAGNHAGIDGGAIHSWVGGPKLKLTNCTIAANRADNEGGSIYAIYGITITASNTLVWGNSSAPAIKTGNAAVATWKHSLVEGCGGSAAWDATEMGTDGGGNLDADPLFVSPPAPSAAPTLDGDFTFDADSPAFDAGDTSLTTSTTDLSGDARVQADGIDLGAYENVSLQRPTFSLAGDISVLEDSGAYTETAFAYDANANDDGQSLTGYEVSTDNDALFAELPRIDASGNLTFKPASDAYGVATASVVLHDDGDSLDESAPKTFTITLRPVNDPPAFTLAGDIDASSADGLVTMGDFLTDVDFIEPGQSYADVAVGNDHAALFTVPPGLDGSRLQFRVAPLRSGEATVSVSVSDDGGSADGGSATTTKTFVIRVSQSERYAIAGPVFDPRSYASLGSFDDTAGYGYVTLDSDTGAIDGDFTATSTCTDVAEDGTRYRLFVFDEFRQSGILEITGSTPVALVSKGDLTVTGIILYDGTAGAAGALGSQGGDGTDGGSLVLVAHGKFTLASGYITCDGGSGGAGGNAMSGAFPGDGGDGGKGGDGGSVTIAASTYEISPVSAFSLKGGAGGAGGSPGMPDAATGNEGAGGNGGRVAFYGTGWAASDFVDDGNGQFRLGSSLNLFLNGGDGGTAGSNGSFDLPDKPAYLGATRLHVDASRSGGATQNGYAWATAFADLQDALAVALAGDELWVAQGAYHPDEAEAGLRTIDDDDAGESFSPPDGVSLYGGFAGDETARDQRDPDARPTILSGDIDHESSPDNATGGVVLSDPLNKILGTNASHLITGGATLLDGFTLTGAADGAVTGGGTFRRCTFQGNLSGAGAGAGFHENETVRYLECDFLSNRGAKAATIYASQGDVALVSCRFLGNEGVGTESGRGSVIVVSGDALIANCLVAGNLADGGAIAVANDGVGGSSPRIVQTTLAYNRQPATGSAPALYVESPETAALANTLVWGNTGASSDQIVGAFTAADCLIEGLSPAGNLDGTTTSPVFRDPVNAAFAPTLAGDYRLFGQSPLIHAGSASELPADTHDLDEDGDTAELLPLDLAGNARENGAPDLGAYEYAGPAIVSTPGDQTIGASARLSFGLEELFTGYDELAVAFGTGGVVSFSYDEGGSYFDATGQSGDTTTVTLTATAAATGDQAFVTFTITLVETDALAAFRSQYGLAADGSDDEADWSGNGVDNIFYYLFGLGDPHEASVDRTRLPTLSTDGDYLVFSYLSPASSYPVYSEPITSTDLQTWVTVASLPASEVAVTSAVESDGYLRYTVRMSNQASRRFFSVRAETND